MKPPCSACAQAFDKERENHTVVSDIFGVTRL
jgi:hypothetical protein